MVEYSSGSIIATAVVTFPSGTDQDVVSAAAYKIQESTVRAVQAVIGPFDEALGSTDNLSVAVNIGDSTPPTPPPSPPPPTPPPPLKV